MASYVMTVARVQQLPRRDPNSGVRTLLTRRGLEVIMTTMGGYRGQGPLLERRSLLNSRHILLSGVGGGMG